MPVIALLLIVAGTGYMVDSLGTLLSPSYGLEVSIFTFVGEVIFIFWLLIRGGRISDTSYRST